MVLETIVLPLHQTPKLMVKMGFEPIPTDNFRSLCRSHQLSYSDHNLITAVTPLLSELSKSPFVLASQPLADGYENLIQRLMTILYFDLSKTLNNLKSSTSTVYFLFATSQMGETTIP